GWRQVNIPVSDFKGMSIEVAEQIKGIAFEQANSDGKEHMIYVDQVDVRPAAAPAHPSGLKAEIASIKGFERHIDLSWKPLTDERIAGTIIERSADGVHFTALGFRPRWMNRYADYVGCEHANYHYRICFLGYDNQRSSFSSSRNASTKAMTDDELLDM